SSFSAIRRAPSRHWRRSINVDREYSSTRWRRARRADRRVAEGRLRSPRLRDHASLRTHQRRRVEELQGWRVSQDHDREHPRPYRPSARCYAGGGGLMSPVMVAEAIGAPKRESAPGQEGASQESFGIRNSQKIKSENLSRQVAWLQRRYMIPLHRALALAP